MSRRYILLLSLTIVFSGIVIVCLINIYLNNDMTFKLEMVQVIFRNGERIPDKSEVYKTDPYDPEYYIHPGYGQLTKVGKEHEFQIGLLLKERYGSFIGKYNADYVYGYSTDFDRTKESLQMVLAGLFSPPTNQSISEKILNWVPVETHYEPVDSDFILGPMINSCAKFGRLLKEAENSPGIQKQLHKYDNILSYVRNVTGIGSSRAFTVTFIARNLAAVKRMGLALPTWVTKEVQNMLDEMSALFWETLSLTPELRKIAGGPLVQKILENMKNHDKGDERKIYLYCGHDQSVASFTKVHNFTGIPMTAAFGSTLIIEHLRGSDDESYVRMFLWTGDGKKLIKLKLEKCDYECPLSKYEKIAKPLLPDSDYETCPSENLLGRINPIFRLTYVAIEDDTLTFKYDNEAL